VKANWDENRQRKEAGEEVSSKDYLGTGTWTCSVSGTRGVT